jgi:hypothetical protein
MACGRRHVAHVWRPNSCMCLGMGSKLRCCPSQERPFGGSDEADAAWKASTLRGHAAAAVPVAHTTGPHGFLPCEPPARGVSSQRRLDALASTCSRWGAAALLELPVAPCSLLLLRRACDARCGGHQTGERRAAACAADYAARLSAAARACDVARLSPLPPSGARRGVPPAPGVLAAVRCRRVVLALGAPAWGCLLHQVWAVGLHTPRPSPTVALLGSGPAALARSRPRRARDAASDRGGLRSGRLAN